MTHLLANMTRDEIARRLADHPVAFLPLGATEQHGHHLPMGTDNFLAEAYALKLAEKVNGVVLPTVPFGYSWVWQDVPGTITVQNETLERYLWDVFESVERCGYSLLVLVDGHESNVTSMKYVVRRYADRSKFPVVRLFYPRMAEAHARVCETGTWFGMFHACEFETSLMLEALPKLVDMSKAVAEYPDYSPEYAHGSEQLGNLSTSGVFGDARAASAEKGRRLFDHFVTEGVGIIRHFQGKRP